MFNNKRTPVSINTSDTTEYLDTNFNLASTILHSTKKLKSFRFLNILGIPPLHFVDQNKYPKKCKSTMPN